MKSFKTRLARALEKWAIHVGSAESQAHIWVDPADGPPLLRLWSGAEPDYEVFVRATPPLLSTEAALDAFLKRLENLVADE